MQGWNGAVGVAVGLTPLWRATLDPADQDGDQRTLELGLTLKRQVRRQVHNHALDSADRDRIGLYAILEISISIYLYSTPPSVPTQLRSCLIYIRPH